MELCDTEFFNLNSVWHVDRPQLSTCFRDTALVWLPAAVLAITALLECSSIQQAKLKGKKAIPRNNFNAFRQLLVIALFCMKLLESFDHDYLRYREADDNRLIISASLAPIIQALSHLILGVIYHKQRKAGIHTSGPILAYLFVKLICCAFDYSAVLSASGNPKTQPDLVWLYIDYTYFPLLFLLFICECNGDTPVLEEDVDTAEEGFEMRPTNPELSASFCSRITFWWYNSFLLNGYKSELSLRDLWRTLPRDNSTRLAPIFHQAWMRTSRPKAIGKKVETFVRANGDLQEKNHILLVLARIFSKRLAVTAFMKLLSDTFDYSTPMVLKAFLVHLNSDNPAWHGYLLAVLLFITPFAHTFMLENYFYKLQFIGQHTRAMIVGAVYRKSMVLSGSSRLQSTSGEIINLMSVDTEKFPEIVLNVNQIWSGPLQITVSIALLYRELGWSIFAGVICMVVLLPVNAYLANRVRRTQIKVMATKDERVKQINEMINGIKVIKLYAWENSFMANLFRYRNRELAFLTRILTFDAVQTFLWQCSPFMVACVTFSVYVSVDSSNVLTAEKAFVSICLFNMLKFPLTILPQLITNSILTLVSARRLDRFLNSDELVEYVKREESPEAINIEGATMAWTSQCSTSSAEVRADDEKAIKTESPKPILRDINLRVKAGSFVAIVGQVGSGKTSLISSMLGEMHRISGRFNICRGLTMAYVPQRAFIQNMTVKDNILFGSPHDDVRYEEVLSACSLRDDLLIMPGGDQTEIGERGINLSGGQKQRVSLARACYSNSDIYLLDDPLSALDSHVAKRVYEEVLSSSTGLLRDKTRVLATNSLFVLPYVDQVVVLENGRIVESGTYQELISNENGTLAEVMRQYNVGQEEEHESADSGGEIAARGKVVQCQAESPMMESRRLEAAEKQQKKPEQPVGAAKELGKLTDAERMEVGTVNSRVYWAYFFTSYTPKWLLSIMSCMGMAAVFQVCANMWLSAWSSDSNNPDNFRDESLRWLRVAVYALLGGSQCLSVLLASLALRRGAIRASRELHKGLLERVMQSPMTFFDTTPIGRVVNRFARDIDVVDSVLPNTARSWFECLLTVLSTVFVISYMFPQLLILLIPLACFYVMVQRVFIVTTRQLKRLESTNRSPILSNFDETLIGVSTIRAYKCVDRFQRRSDRLVDRNQSCSLSNVTANRWLSIRLAFFANLTTCAVAMFAVTYQVSAGEAGLTLSYSISVTGVLIWLVRMNSDLETNIVGVERILDYMNNDQEDAWIKADSRPPRDWPQAGAISVRQYSTRYRPETDLVLRDISVDIRPREKIGIVGRTGSGKSSLSLSLFRILEADAGSIAIDSLDITHFGLHDIRSQLTIIPQDPVLFSGTLRFNLDPLQLYSDLDIWRALELAHLRAYINTLDKGLDYEVSEYGENFSVGQRQLICLARAILRKTKILVLDEATASVDLETDAVVQRTIRNVFKDCTIITIAHRLHTILDSDRILVLDNGRVLELGSPGEMIKKQDSAFASLVRDAGIDPGHLQATYPATTDL